MSYVDLQPALRDWPYVPDQISVRKILGADSVVRIQTRVELGIVQMETVGRPDGLRPHGCESFLGYHQQRLEQHLDRNGSTLGFLLGRKDCEELRAEASMYYRRYVALYVLEEYDEVVRDTQHNLAIYDLCRDFGSDPDDRVLLECYRPHVLMMDARARASQAVEGGEYVSALAHVNRGLTHIAALLDERHLVPDDCPEVRILQRFAAELGQQMPDDSVVVVRRALRTAIEQERFEEAARLRDKLQRQLGENQAHPTSPHE